MSGGAAALIAIDDVVQAVQPGALGDRAKSVVIKRSMGHGYAGIDDELRTHPKTGTLFRDAKKVVGELKATVRSFAGA